MSNVSSFVLAALAAVAMLPRPAQADTARRLAELVAVPGVPGYEAPVREAIEMLLPTGARVRADNMGNILLRTGKGSPHTLIVAPLDEPGVVVSAITDDGYLRVHRHTGGRRPALAIQYFMGQRVDIHAASGAVVHGVTAIPSVHLRGMRDPALETPIRSLDEVWIDVGAESRADVDALGIRLLDSVTLSDRGLQLAGTRVSGVAAANRAAALGLAELVRRTSGRGAAGSFTLAWVVQSEYGNRGLLRLLETTAPDRLVVLRGAPDPGDQPRGAIGQLGTGPIVTEGGLELPEKWRSLQLRTVHVPVLFAGTPVETVDARDVDALAAWIASEMGLTLQATADDDASATGPAVATPAASEGARADGAARWLDTLRTLIETPGVSGHEAAVRAEVLARLPAWAKPQVDDRGNITVSVGSGGKPLLFIAHMDEVGYEITEIAADGTAAVRTRGGMYLSVYEAHPVLVQTAGGAVPAVLAPRQGYTTATQAQPRANDLFVYFGTDTAAETAALGVAPGQALTIRKQFVRLGQHRVAGRAMDDRVGSTALIEALHRIDPSSIPNQVTFAWSVEEETGLTGAAHLATRLKPDTAFAVDTFVSTDTPVDIQRLAGAKLGRGAVLRVLDSRTIVPPHVVDRVTAIAREARLPLQLGTTSGGTDASAFSSGGAIDGGLSWPGRYSHSPIEVMDTRDFETLVQLIAAVARNY